MKLNKILLLGFVLILLSSFTFADSEWINDTTFLVDYFERANSATVGNGWSETEYASGTVKIDSETMYLEDGGSSKVAASKGLTGTASGLLRYHIRIKADQTNLDSTVKITNGASTLMYIGLRNTGNSFYYTPTDSFNDIEAYSSGTWYDIDVYMDLDLDNASIYINNVSKVSGITIPDLIPNSIEAYTSAATNGYFRLDNVYVINGTFQQITVPKFKLTTFNGYNTTAINDFNATFINVTNTTNLQTTNGTIEYNKNEIVNLTIGGGDYFNKTFTNYNTSTNLNANLTQTNITFNFVFNNTLTPITTPINVTDLTTGVEFTATNGTLNIPPNANTNLNFNISCQLDVFIPRNITYNFNAREISNYTIELEPTLVNLTFLDKSTSNPIENATINIKYPSGDDIDVITNSNGSALFSYVNVNTVEFGNYNITFEGTQGFISPVSFIREINSTNVPYSEEFNISQANIIINIYDREDNSILSGVDVEVFMQGVFNETTSTGQLIINNLTVIEDTYTLVAFSDGYFTEQKSIDFTNKENLTLNFYMLNVTGTNTGSHFVTVINEFFIEQPDTVVELFEVDLITNTAKKVSECLANNNGECFFGIELGVKKYVFTGTKTIDGILNTDSTNPEGVFINIDNDITRLFLKVRDDFVSSSITDLNIVIYNNLQMIWDDITNTTSINVSFTTDSGSSTTICLDYYTFIESTKTLDSYQCVNSDSGSILSTKLLNRSNNYNIEIYQVENLLKILYFTENVLNINSFEKTADNEGWLSPLVLVPYILILAFAYWSKRIMWFWIGAITISWCLVAWLPSIMITSVAVIITFVCLFEIKISMKKRIEI